MSSKKQPTFNRSDIELALSKEFPDLNKSQISLAIDSILESIVDAVALDEKVEIRGFGTFSKKHIRPRKFINPKTKVYTDGMCVEQSQLNSPEELWLHITRVKLNQQGDKL